jgi:hypothetical protein
VWFYENVVPFKNNDLYEFLGKGDGTFAAAKLLIQNLTGPAMADLNHDGLPDIVDNRNPQANYPNPASPQFTIYLCQADGSFKLTNNYTPYGGQKSLEAAAILHGWGILTETETLILLRSSKKPEPRVLWRTLNSCWGTAMAPLLPHTSRITSTLRCRRIHSMSQVMGALT